MSAMKFKICLLGDMVRHVILKPNPETETEKNSPKNTDYKAYIEITGAPILRKMICNVLEYEENNKLKKGIELNDIGPVYPSYSDDLNAGIKLDSIKGMRLINILKYYPRSSRTEHDHDQILRIESGSEYLASMADSDNENKLNILKELFVSLQFNKSKPNFNILVIYDRNSYLRELILKDTDIQEKLKNLAIEATGGIVIAIRKNIDDGWLKHLHEKLHLVNNGGRERQGNRIKTLLTLEVK